MTIPHATIQDMANAIRFLSIDTILHAREGHQGVPLGMAEIAATLYANHVKLAPQNPTWPDRDRVVLSNGHGSMLLYSLLHLSGFEHVDMDAIKSFRKLGSVCAGHPEIEQDAGIEITTGLLGQGIASAVGMALAETHLAAKFGNDLVDHRTWAFVGDGCLQEGMGQEAISLAGHLKLGKLTFLWDDNHITDDGDTALSISEDIPARFIAAGWHVQSIDGHDIAAIDAAITAAKSDDRPSLIACRTTIARGIPRLQGQRGGHSAPLTAQDATEARELMHWPHSAHVIPAAIYEAWTTAMARGTQDRELWLERLCASEKQTQFQAQIMLPNRLADADWQAIETTITTNDPRATILSSGDVCDALLDFRDDTIVLCADLEAPTNHKRRRESFSIENRAGTYVHCGVREHLMAAMANGIAAHGGLVPIAVTYLAFADYQRASMRMAAVMELPVIYVFSHDSIGVGSNGPTHQPVETLASFRAMPNMQVFRPADTRETIAAWRHAFDTTNGPSMFALSRQELPQIPKTQSDNAGGYILSDPVQPDVCLIATGSEVHLATQAAQALKPMGISARVVSIPCFERFQTLPKNVQALVLGDAPRIICEAAMQFGWEQFMHPGDKFIGMSGFGASAIAPVLFDHFGITKDAIIAAACDRLGIPFVEV